MEDIISVEEELWNQQMNATLNCSSLYSSLDRNWTELDSLQNNCSIASCPDRDPGPPMRGFPILVLEFAKILYGIVCLVGLCGNTLVIYVVLRFSKMQTVTNMYILNLAVADEMFLVGLPFLIATVIFKVSASFFFHKRTSELHTNQWCNKCLRCSTGRSEGSCVKST